MPNNRLKQITERLSTIANITGVQGLLEEQCQQVQMPEELTSSVEIQVCITPITRDAQTQIAPEKRHTGK